MDQFVRAGVSEAEAFQRAVAQLGPPATVAAEFRKLSAFRWWPVRIVIAVWMAAILSLVCNFHPPDGRMDFAIEITVLCFATSIGMGSGILHGVLGACFVMQRCYSDFSPRCLHALFGVSRSFAWVGAGFTVFGMAWGEFWAHSPWTHHAGFNPGVEGWSVVVWLVAFLAAHRSRSISARGLLVASLLGCNLILLVWFRPWLGPGLAGGGGLQSSADPMHVLWMFMAAPLWLLNLLLFLVGLAPAGWLRLHKA